MQPFITTTLFLNREKAPFSPRSAFPIILFVGLTLAAILWFMIAESAEAAVNCTDSDWLVGDETDLNNAIGCFNAKPAGDYSITLTQNINLTAKTAQIDNATADVTLLLKGDGFIVDGQNGYNVRPFFIGSDTVITMQNITVTGGHSTYSGGGIYTDGILTIIDSNISNNSADGEGGGIYNPGTITITNSTISGNSANSGGGMLNLGKATLTQTAINNNSADTIGGGIENTWAGKLTIEKSTLANNVAEEEGGGISNSFVASAVTINASTINNNSADSGGGISNYYSLTIINSTISGNSASSNGGGIYNSQKDWSYGTVTISSSTISNNSAVVGGGINNMSPTKMTISNTIVANSSSGSDCVNDLLVTMTDGGHNIIEDNSCGFTGGSDPMLGPLQDNGGDTFTHKLLPGSPAIDAGDSANTSDQRGVTRPQGNADDIGAFERYDCTGQSWSIGTEIELNEAIGCYNGQTIPDNYTLSLTQNISLTASSRTVWNTVSGVTLWIEGNGHTVDGQGLPGVRPFTIATATVTINNLTISGGNVTNNGGGIYTLGTLTVSNSILSSNLANTSHGGGIYNDGGTLTVNNSTFSNNSAINSRDGGGINNHGGTLIVNNSTFSGNSANARGGGIFNSYSASSILIVNNSTFSNNSASSGGGINNNGNGSTLTVSNSTFSGNSAATAGGGIINYSSGSINNSTFFGNSALFGGGIDAPSPLSINNSIIANSRKGGDCLGSISSGGYNLASDTTCNLTGEGDINNTDPQLGPLANNGGGTWTHALLYNSPAINAGNTTLTTDQRGTARPQGEADDIGAVEMIHYTLTITEDGTGSGAVSTTPADIECNNSCVIDLVSGTVVTLTAVAETGSTFSGWSGDDCSGSGSCVIGMGMSKSVTATFTLENYTLTTIKAGTGGGIVTGSPASIDCGDTCAANFDYGTVVTLTAVADTGSLFAGWSGAGCSDVGACVVTMDETKAVTATFEIEIKSFTLFLPLITNPGSSPPISKSRRQIAQIAPTP